jgi:hypothetical protein
VRPSGWGECRKPSACGRGEAEPPPAKLSFQDTVFLAERGDDLLLVPLEPASDHGDQDVEDHSAPQVGGSDIIAWPNMQRNLRNFNGIETAENFNLTGYGLCHFDVR